MDRTIEGRMTEYRLIGNGVKDGERSRVAFNARVGDGPVTRAELERAFGARCEQWGYAEPDLVDWYPV